MLPAYAIRRPERAYDPYVAAHFDPDLQYLARIQLPPTGLARDFARRRHPASATPEGARVSSLRLLAFSRGSGGSRASVAS